METSLQNPQVARGEANAPPPAAAPAFRLTEDWVAWLEENVRLSKPPGSMSEAMMANGCPPELARGLVEAFSLRTKTASIQKDSRFDKARWLLDSLRLLQHSAPSGPVIERRTLDPDEFFEHFYSRNVPVVYRDAISPRHLGDLLDWERLEKTFGSMAVEIQEGRASHANFERDSSPLKSMTDLASFLQRVREADDTNDFYMTARNGSANAALVAAAMDPASLCPELLDGTQADGNVFLWIGPRGTFTPAHHDLTNNFFLQVKGSKEFRLASSLALLEVDNDRHCYLASSLSEIDRRRVDSGLPALSFTVTLGEGDILFIPLGWWHEVRGLTASISLSATHFRAKNDFYRTYHF